tara:strand:+ start:190 stop:792 length:603 start_codon:yes stop_codon:yes gene_type:complete
MSFVDIGKIDLPDWQFDEEDWNNDLGNLRKDKLTIFRHIDSICLQWQYAKGKPYKVAQKTDFYDKYYDKKFFTELEQKLHDFYGHGYFVSLLFARLKPNGRIEPHVDGGLSVVHNRDIHIPVSTNKNCVFTVGDSTRHMKIGEIVEIDNTVTHSVVNDSEESRIHLMVEWCNTEKGNYTYEYVDSVFGDNKKYKIWKSLN